MKRKKTDRVATAKEEEFHNLIKRFGLESLLYVTEFLKEHPESRLKEYFHSCNSYEEVTQLIDSFLKDPKTKFEYEAMVEHVVRKVTGIQEFRLEGEVGQ